VTPAVTPLVAASPAFYVVFGVFAVAFLALSIVTIGWAIRQDRSGRDRWRQRQQAGQGDQEPGPPTASPPAAPSTNGHKPARRPGSSQRPPG
jgi:hypothetical protein